MSTPEEHPDDEAASPPEEFQDEGVEAEDEDEGIEASDVLEELGAEEATRSRRSTLIRPSELSTDYNDAVEDQTYGRRLARRLAQKSWYFPHNDDDEDAPSLDRAWQYFEHVALPRHLRQDTYREEDPTASIRRRAEYGESEKPTQLYSIFKTTEADLAEFGVGIGIYFWTLRVLVVILLIAGFINLPIMVYFSSDDYSSFGQSLGGGVGNVTTLGLIGSAVCTEEVWKACPNCTRDDWDHDRADSNYHRYASAGSLNFILRNECEITSTEGILAWVSLLFVAIAIYVMGWISRVKENKLDEGAQTTTDYSLEVENPPFDAKDPEEWRDFFSQFEKAHVTCCTVALDNEDLIRALVQRRKLVLEISYLLKPGVKLDPARLMAQEEGYLESMLDHCMPQLWWKKWIFFTPEAPVLMEKIQLLREKIKTLAVRETHVSNVFITFETEQAQRQALTALAIPKVHLWRNNTAALPENLLFRGKHLLSVKEPPEPSSVRWQDLDETLTKKAKQILGAFTLSILAIVGGAVVIFYARERSAIAAALTISIINQVTPRVCRWITNLCETHSSEGQRLSSLYIKMTVFRWTNTVIIISLINAFTSTVTNGSKFLINSVYAIFFAELLTTPVLQLSDLWGHIQRHFFGPRAPDQFRMNLNFRGGYFELSDRYTGMTKTLFLTFFYSAVFPGGFFFAAIILCVVYVTDKFSLFRIWGQAPNIGNEICQFSRNYFFPAALLGYSLMLSYFYAGWPFDNACENDGVSVPAEYEGTHTATDGDGNEFLVTIPQGDTEYFYCLQDMFRFRNPRAFPATSSKQRDGEEWMTSDQEGVTDIMGWTSIAALAIVGTIFFNRTIGRALRNLFRSPYKPTGQAMAEKFSQVHAIKAYIPQVRVSGLQYPVLACDVSSIDHDLIGWEDPADPQYNFHNICADLPEELKMGDNRVFSAIAHWPPPAEDASLKESS